MRHCLHLWETVSQVPSLTTNRCHIWQIDLTQGHLEQLGNLSKQEIERGNHYKSSQDRLRFYRNRSIIRQLAGVYIDLPADAIEFVYNPQGKPAINLQPTSTPLHFNLSHSGDIGLLAFCRSTEIGIDIEYINRNANYYKLAQRFFSKDEFAVIAATEPENISRQFFRLWTRKEAFVKAVGTGLGFPLNKFSVNSALNEKPGLIAIDPSRYEGPCSMYDIEIRHDYMATIAGLSQTVDCSLLNWPLVPLSK
ncbi:MAG: 4'-phosphopantetheinyl transferase superfamily protein [Thiohalomonadales bacterium]